MKEIWTTPWAMVALDRTARHSAAAGGEVEVPEAHPGAVWGYETSKPGYGLGKTEAALEPVVGFNLENDRGLGLLPLPLHAGGDPRTGIQWPGSLTRPRSREAPASEADKAAASLFARAQLVWDRLSDVEAALGDPINLWSELNRRWTEDDDSVEPRMDVIVRHAKQYGRDLDDLAKAPRRVLRRTHRMTRIDRIGEFDRRAMTWLVRQPGETLVERAGDDQRVLAVAREQNFNTLENRVVRSYAALALSHARAYLDRYANKHRTRRFDTVKRYAQRCRRVERLLREAGVTSAEPGITPNFVLMNNARYRSVWAAWIELLKASRIEDDLWRWQPRSFEEFTALALMAGLQGVRGARLVAASPMTFREDQLRGSWVEHENPLGVWDLQEQGVVVDVQYRVARPAKWQADFAAPIWIRYGRKNDLPDVHKRIAVWPIWSRMLSGSATQVRALDGVPARYRQQGISGLMVVTPTDVSQSKDVSWPVAEIGLGMIGDALGTGVRSLATAIVDHIEAEMK